MVVEKKLGAQIPVLLILNKNRNQYAFGPNKNVWVFDTNSKIIVAALKMERSRYSNKYQKMNQLVAFGATHHLQISKERKFQETRLPAV